LSLAAAAADQAGVAAVAVAALLAVVHILLATVLAFRLQLAVVVLEQQMAVIQCSVLLQQLVAVRVELGHKDKMVY
jgi:hypothetical protein